MTRLLLLVPVLFLAALAAGCSRSPQDARRVDPDQAEPLPAPREKDAPKPAPGKPAVSVPSAPAANPSVSANDEAGVLSGVVRWSGAVPELPRPARPDELSVTVNGQDAQLDIIQPGLVDWTVQLPLPRDGRVVAAAVDEAGNREALAHIVVLRD